MRAGTWRSASAFSLTTEGLGLVGRGEEFVLDTTLSVSDTALEGDRDLKAGVNQTLCTQELYPPLHHRGYKNKGTADVWLTVHRNSVWIRKTN